MTPIERAARAILKVRFYDCEPEMYGNDLDEFYREIDPDHVIGAHHEARAAIGAVREPNPLMMAAAWQRITRDKKAAGIARLGPGAGFSEWWTAILDAILNEVPTS